MSIFFRNKCGSYFSAASWSKSYLMTVLATCNIPKCYRKVFFSPNFTFVLLSCSNSMGIVDCIWSNRPKNGFFNKAFHNFFWLFLSKYSQQCYNCTIVTSFVYLCIWLVFIRAHSFLFAFTHICT